MKDKRIHYIDIKTKVKRTKDPQQVTNVTGIPVTN